MRTVVQLRSPAPDAPTCELIYGEPDDFVGGTNGSIAGFSPGEVVAYLIQGGPARRLFVFRTLDGEEKGAARLPGVRPRVRLLLEVRSAGRIDRVRRLFAYLLKQGFLPSLLTDGFYVRGSHGLGGRLPAQKVVRALLP